METLPPELIQKILWEFLGGERKFRRFCHQIYCKERFASRGVSTKRRQKERLNEFTRLLNSFLALRLVSTTFDLLVRDLFSSFFQPWKASKYNGRGGTRSTTSVLTGFELYSGRAIFGASGEFSGITVVPLPYQQIGMVRGDWMIILRDFYDGDTFCPQVFWKRFKTPRKQSRWCRHYGATLEWPVQIVRTCLCHKGYDPRSKKAIYKVFGAKTRARLLERIDELHGTPVYYLFHRYLRRYVYKPPGVLPGVVVFLAVWLARRTRNRPGLTGI